MSTAGYTSLRAAKLDNLTGSVALASQIPANFTSATFAAAGVFATAALANAPTGGGLDPWATSLPGSYGAGTAGYLLSHGVQLAANGLDQITVKTGVNLRQAMSPILASAAGVVSGATAGASTVVIKGGNVATTRINATTDALGNRTSVTLTLPT